MGLIARKRKQVEQIVEDLDTLADDRKKVLDTWEAGLAHRPPAAADGVDLTAITQADPAFDGQAFLAIARETFYLVRQARTSDDAAVADDLLSPSLAGELNQAIDGDVTSHRHHLLPGLEIENAVITRASLVDGAPQLTVRVHVWSALEGDALQNGIDGGEQWDEDWTFTRAPALDASTTDRAHTMRPGDEGGWMFPHRGWVATAITRAGADAAAG